MSSNKKAENAPRAPGVAVKAVIIQDSKILLLLRCQNDEHAPCVWEIPGGRLDTGESPKNGLKREVQEETGLIITTHAPLDIQHFTRDDGQIITMIISLCRSKENSVTLSSEHTEYKWAQLDDPLIPEWLHVAIKRAAIYERHDRANTVEQE